MLILLLVKVVIGPALHLIFLLIYPVKCGGHDCYFIDFFTVFSLYTDNSLVLPLFHASSMFQTDFSMLQRPQMFSGQFWLN